MNREKTLAKLTQHLSPYQRQAIRIELVRFLYGDSDTGGGGTDLAFKVMLNELLRDERRWCHQPKPEETPCV